MNNLSIAGKLDAWHIDHRFSILKGYQQKISPLVIGHLSNLQMLPWKDNISKHSKCSISLDELFVNCNYSIKKSKLEFDQIMELIECDIAEGVPPERSILVREIV